MTDSDVSNLIIKDNKSLWYNYACQANILSDFREIYIIAFLFPASVCAIVALVLSEFLNSAYWINIVLGAVAILTSIEFLMGWALYTHFYRKIGNMWNYEKEYLSKTHELPAVDKYPIETPIAFLATGDKKRAFYRSILYSLGNIFVIDNSILISLLVASMLANSRCPVSATLAISIMSGLLALLIFHWQILYTIKSAGIWGDRGAASPLRGRREQIYACKW